MMLLMQANHPLPGLVSPRCSVIRPWRTAGFILAFVAFSSLAIRSQTTAATKTQNRISRAVEVTLAQGHDALLPPHISHLLGISPESLEVPVKQFATMGEAVRGFEVSLGDHDIVIFVEDRAKNESTFYLLSFRGNVRKVVSVQEGVGYDRTPTPADRKALEKEREFWLDRLAPEPHSQSDKH
jgi:hypothetical protein